MRLHLAPRPGERYLWLSSTGLPMSAPFILAEVAGLVLLVGVLFIAAGASRKDDDEA